MRPDDRYGSNRAHYHAGPLSEMEPKSQEGAGDGGGDRSNGYMLGQHHQDSEDGYLDERAYRSENEQQGTDSDRYSLAAGES